MKKELAVEIGPRFTPKIRLLREDLRPQGSVMLVEKRKLWIDQIARDDYAWRVQGSSQRLPLTNDSVDLIFASDFFGADGGIALIGKDHNYDYETMGSGHAYEWKRVCSPKGRVIIIEMSSPPPINYITNKFTGIGFELEEENVGVDGNRIYGYGFLNFMPEGYSLVFRKK